MATAGDSKDKKIPEVPHLEDVTGVEKIPVSAAGGLPRYIEVKQIVDKANKEVLGKKITTDNASFELGDIYDLHIAADEPLQIQGALVDGPLGNIGVLNIGIDKEQVVSPDKAKELIAETFTPISVEYIDSKFVTPPPTRSE